MTISAPAGAGTALNEQYATDSSKGQSIRYLENPSIPAVFRCSRADAGRGSGNSGAPRCGGCSSSPRCSLARSRVLAIRAAAGAGRSIWPRRPRRRRRHGDFAVGHPGLPAVLAALWLADSPVPHAVHRYLALRRPPGKISDRRGWARGHGHGMGLISRAHGARCPAGLHGRRAEIGAGRRRALAADAGFCVAAPLTEEFFARGFLYRGWSECFLGSPARSCCRRWCGPRCICNMTGSFSARSFGSACARLPALSQPFDLADDRAARPEQSRRGGADHLSCGAG